MQNLLTRWQVYQFITSSKIKIEVRVLNPQGFYLYLDRYKPNLQVRDKEFKIEDKI